MSQQSQPPRPHQQTQKEAGKGRRRPGKCARRRKRKARAILDASAEAAASLRPPSPHGDVPSAAPTTDQLQSNAASRAACAPPSDRGCVPEGARVRRGEHRARRMQSSISRDDAGNRDDAGDGDADTAPDALDANDEFQLRSQLGFVPGNAVCVAARLPVELMGTRSNCISNDDPNDDVDGGDPRRPPPPSVLRLYPIAARESYRGGKSDGRAFKGRRRGDMRVTDNDAGDGGGVRKEDAGNVVNGDDEKGIAKDGKKGDEMTEATATNRKANGKGKKDRSWVIESSVDQEVETCSTTPKGTSGDCERSNNAHNQQQQQRQQQRQLIIEPFPTLYWLTSPTLCSLISKLERTPSTNVPAAERRLRSDPSHLARMERAHASYGRARWDLLTPADRGEIIERGWKGALDESRGVAGIRRRDGVKCLHTHAAHYLAQLAEWEEGRESSRANTNDDVDGGGGEETSLESSMKRFDGEDMNLVGKWTMESVLELIERSLSVEGLEG